MKIHMEIELDYDEDLMHGDDKDGREWFFNKVLRGPDLILFDLGDLGDAIGKVRVTSLDEAPQ